MAAYVVSQWWFKIVYDSFGHKSDSGISGFVILLIYIFHNCGFVTGRSEKREDVLVQKLPTWKYLHQFWNVENIML